MEVLRRQAAAVGVLLGVIGLALAAGAIAVPALLIAAVVEGRLLVCLAVVGGRRRDAALDLISAGRGGLPVAAVQRERARLLDERHLAALARSLEALRREAAAPYRDRPIERPLHSPSTIRQVDGDLECMIALLCDPRPGPAVVARIERLLGNEMSPLYGDDVRRLREELRSIMFTGGNARPLCSPNRAGMRTLLALVAVAVALVALCGAPAASSASAASPRSACHSFQRFSEIWRLCPDADGALRRERVGVLP